MKHLTEHPLENPGEYLVAYPMEDRLSTRRRNGVLGWYATLSSVRGLDGKTKMNESLGNCIYLRDSVDMVDKKVTRMYTDPKRTRRRIPGRSKETPYLFTTMH